MADEVLEFAFQATGQDVVQKAFEDLKLKQLEASAEARRLAGELRTLSGSEGETSQRTEELQRSLIRAQQAAAQYGRQAQQVVTQTRAQSQAATQQTSALAQNARSWGAVGSAMGQVGGVLGHLSPQLGSLGGIVGQVGGAVTGLTGAMGPWGLAIGAVTAAVGIAIPLLDALTGEMDDNAAAADRAERSVRELADAYRERNEQQNRLAGIASAESINQQIRDETDAIAEQRRELTQLLRPYEDYVALQQEAGGTGENLLQILRRTAAAGDLGTTVVGSVETARQALDLMRQVEQQAEGVALMQQNLALTGGVQGRSGREIAPGMPGYIPTAEQQAGAAQRQAQARARANRPNRAAASARAQELREEDRLDQQWHEMWDRRREQEAQDRVRREHWVASQIAESRQFLDDLDQEHTERTIARAEEVAARAAEIRTNEIAKAQEARQHIEAIYGQMSSQISSVGGDIAQFGGQLVKQLISGADLTSDAFLAMLDSFLEATSIQYTIKALAEAAEAVAAIARYDYASAAEHGVAAGLAAAVAAATGIGAAAIPNVPTTGPGGGPATAQQAAGPAGPSNITIQLYAPQAVFTEAERGTIIASGIRAARRELGPASVRT